MALVLTPTKSTMPASTRGRKAAVEVNPFSDPMQDGNLVASYLSGEAYEVTVDGTDEEYTTKDRNGNEAGTGRKRTGDAKIVENLLRQAADQLTEVGYDEATRETGFPVGVRIVYTNVGTVKAPKVRIQYAAIDRRKSSDSEDDAE